VVVSTAVREKVQELLPGERIEHLVPAVVPGSISGNVYVVVTTRWIHVLSTAFLGRGRPRRVIARHPRSTPVGEPERNGVPGFLLGGIFYEVDDEYLSVVSALHRESSGSGALPPDPLD
jgi:hypothetical protein